MNCCNKFSSPRTRIVASVQNTQTHCSSHSLVLLSPLRRGREVSFDRSPCSTFTCKECRPTLAHATTTAIHCKMPNSLHNLRTSVSSLRLHRLATRLTVVLSDSTMSRSPARTLIRVMSQTRPSHKGRWRFAWGLTFSSETKCGIRQGSGPC